MKRRSKLDLHLQSRGDFWTYYRRVPKSVEALDARFPLIRTALGTNDLALARRQRDRLAEADDAYWSALLSGAGTDRTANDHAAAVKKAMALGFSYRTAQDLAEKATWEELSLRMEVVKSLPQENRTDAALLGLVPAPTVRYSDALKIFIDEIYVHELAKMSRQQRRKWQNIPERAIRNFVEIVGDIPLADITRIDAVKFYRFWQGKIIPADRKIRPMNPSSGNRQLSELRKLYGAYFDHRHNENERENPFRGLSFPDGKVKTRSSFEEDWIIAKFLSGGALSGMNGEARGILLAMVETGCRPSEICNLTPDSIRHTDRVPHLVIRARTLGDLDWDAKPDVTANDEREAFEPRRLKTTDSARTVPLVGISLEVFKKYPNGFPRYFEGEVAASAAINNYLKDRKLRPTKNHTLYSLRHTFEDRLTRAGVPPIAPYSFRHLFAADLKADAVAKTVIAGALGHRSTATQKRYGTKKQGSSGGMTLVSVTHSNDIRDPDRSFPGTKRVPAPEADDLGMDMTSP